MQMLRLLPLLSLCLIAEKGMAKENSTEDSAVKIYRSYDDYRNDRFIKANDTVIAGNMSMPNAPAELGNIVWGMWRGGKLFRLIGNTYYQVEDTTGLIIYVKTAIETDVVNHFTWVPIPIGKLFPYGFPLNTYNVEDVAKDTYYFSKGMNGKVMELETQNVIDAVKNPSFTAEAKKKFKWYKHEITGYDNKKEQYFVNVLYNRYVK
jgi:hypothetical protein